MRAIVHFMLFLFALFITARAQAPQGKLFLAWKSDDKFFIHLYDFKKESFQNFTIDAKLKLLVPRGSVYDSKRNRILMYANVIYEQVSRHFIYRFPISHDGKITFEGRKELDQFTFNQHHGMDYDVENDKLFVQAEKKGTGVQPFLWKINPDDGSGNVEIDYDRHFFLSNDGFFYHQIQKKIMFIGSADLRDPKFYVVKSPTDLQFFSLIVKTTYYISTLNGNHLVVIPESFNDPIYHYAIDFKNLNNTKVTPIRSSESKPKPFLAFIIGDIYYHTNEIGSRGSILYGYDLIQKKIVYESKDRLPVPKSFQTQKYFENL